jgi:TrmH family RNA methyltransferase
LESDFGWELLRHAEQQISYPRSESTVFESISLKEGPQGLCALVKQNIQELGAHTEVQGVWVALEGVQDPGNLGSVLRTLDAVGVTGCCWWGKALMLPSDQRACQYGRFFTIPIFQTSLENFLV